MKTILVALDSSAMRDAVLAEAIALARAGAGRIVLLTVVQPPVLTSEYAPVVENFGDLIAAGEKAATALLAGARQRVEAEGIVVETVQAAGAPIAHIIDQAEQRQADYILMGSHGHTAFYDLLVGSTTHGVLLRAKCPVIIVPPKKKR